ncbi:glycosyl transferase family 2 [Planctomycetales bacterium]|nr:glycosyl transferase family 2 [Planctomycetales bacterium]
MFNEAECIAAFAVAVSAELQRITNDWEIILVDDGSSDGTWSIVQELHCQEHRIKIIQFSRNFGHQLAVTAGIKYACGDAVIVMDSDLQHPPELIPKMVALWLEGYHAVFTTRTYSKEINWFKRKSSDLFYRFYNAVSDVKTEQGAADYRLLDRKAVEYFNSMSETGRFIRGMVRWLGFRQTSIAFTANSRLQGFSKFTFWRLFSLAVDGITSFSIQPLRWITYAGLAVAAVSMLYACSVFYEVFSTGITTPGWPTLVIAVTFLGGMQLIALGIIGEYVGRIYLETKHRPLFVIQEQVGFEVSNTLTSTATAAAA